MDDGSGSPLIQRGLDAAAEDALRAVFPHGLPPAQRGAGNAIVSSFPLTPDHLVQLKQAMDAQVSANTEQFKLTRIHRRHHRLAQLLAMGLDNRHAAVLVNMHKDRVSILRSDPMFQELMEYYGAQVEEEFKDTAREMADFADDVVQELSRRLEETPEQFTISQLNELAKTFADRSGHGPTSNTNIRQTTVSVTATELERIKNGEAASRSDERPLRVLSPESRSTIEGVFTVTAADVAGTDSPEGVRAGEGLRLREEGKGSPAPRDTAPPVALPRMDQL